MRASDPLAVMWYFASAAVLTVASTLPECFVSVNSRNAIIGAASTRVVARMPVPPAVKTMSGSSTRLSRMQKDDVVQFRVDHTSLVEAANGSPNLDRSFVISIDTFASVSVRSTPKKLRHVSRCGRPARGLRPRTYRRKAAERVRANGCQSRTHHLTNRMWWGSASLKDISSTSSPSGPIPCLLCFDSSRSLRQSW